MDVAAPSIGFRILEFNLLRNGALADRALPQSLFASDAPDTWMPPSNAAEDLGEGFLLWTQRNVLYDIGLDALDG